MSEVKAFANGEQVILEIKARRVGDEVKTEGGLVIGIEQQGEIPTTGTVVSIGQFVDQAYVQLGDVVLLPNGHLQNVPDPRVVTGALPKKSPEAKQFVTTHYKNIAVVYR